MWQGDDDARGRVASGVVRWATAIFRLLYWALRLLSIVSGGRGR